MITICISRFPFSIYQRVLTESHARWCERYYNRRYRPVGAMSRFTPNNETIHEKPRNDGHREHPPQDTKIVAGPSSWLTAWLELALVGWLEVRTVVERLVGLEIAWWWVFVEVSEAPPCGISLPLTRRGGGVNNSPARVSPSFRLCPARCQLMRLSSHTVGLFPTCVLWLGG